MITQAYREEDRKVSNSKVILTQNDISRLISIHILSGYSGGGGNLEEIDVLQAFDPDNHSNARVLAVRIPGLGGHLPRSL